MRFRLWVAVNVASVTSNRSGFVNDTQIALATVFNVRFIGGKPAFSGLLYVG